MHTPDDPTSAAKRRHTCTHPGTISATQTCSAAIHGIKGFKGKTDFVSFVVGGGVCVCCVLLLFFAGGGGGRGVKSIWTLVGNDFKARS